MTANKRPKGKKSSCKHCVRMRWLLTLLMLATMSVILYLDQAAK